MTGALLALALAATPAEGEVVDLFINACINGELSISKENARVIRWHELPHGPRAHVGELRGIASESRFIEVREPGPAYLVTWKSDGRAKDGDQERCYLITDAVEYGNAVRRINEALGGASTPIPVSDNQVSYQRDVPQQRYRLRVWKSRDGYTVMRTAVVDSATAAERLRDQQKQMRKYQERLERKRSQQGEN